MKTMKEEGYRFRKWLGYGHALFEEISTGNLEVYFANKSHAGWGFSWRGTDWEFAKRVTEQYTGISYI